MNRRAFLAGTGSVLFAAPVAAEAQQAGRVYRIGVLATRATPLIFDTFLVEMQKYGWTQGHNSKDAR